MLFNILLIILLQFFIIVIIIKRFVYFKPGKYTEINTEINEKYKEIKHNHLNVWILPNSNSNRVIIYFKDRVGNLTHYQEKIYKLYNLGYKVIAFDYSGYGKSNGVPSEQQLYDDGSIITSYIRQTNFPHEIILYGEGIGASIALHVAIKYNISTVILDSPLPSINVLAKKILGKAKILAFPFTEFNIQSLLRLYSGKSLMFHSIDNKTIPYNSTLTLQKMVTNHIPLQGSQDPPWEDIKKFINDI